MSDSNQKELTKKRVRSLYRFLKIRYDKLGPYTKSLIDEKILDGKSDIIHDSSVDAYFIRESTYRCRSIETKIDGDLWMG